MLFKDFCLETFSEKHWCPLWCDCWSITCNFFITLITDVTPDKWPLNTHLVMRLDLYGPETGTFMLLLLPPKTSPAFIDLLIFNTSKISVLKLMTVYAQSPILEAQGYNDRFDIWLKIFCSERPPWSLEALQFTSSCFLVAQMVWQAITAAASCLWDLLPLHWTSCSNCSRSGQHHQPVLQL